MVPLFDEMVIAPEYAIMSTLLGSQAWLGLGSSWNYKECLPLTVSNYYKQELPHAMDIAFLAALDYKQGKLFSAEKAISVYLRNKVALKSSEC